MIRQYNHKTDFEGVKNLCDKYGINFPNENNFILVAIEDNKIIGITGLKLECKVEPLICSNPVVAVKLNDTIEGVALAQGINVLYANVNKDNLKHINQVKKAGYELIEGNKFILRKEF